MSAMISTFSASQGIPALVNEYDNQAKQFSQGDFLARHKAEIKNHDIKTLTDPKASPTIKQLKEIKDDLAVMNAHIGIVDQIGKEYNKLLKQQTNLNKTQEKIADQKNSISYTPAPTESNTHNMFRDTPNTNFSNSNSIVKAPQSQHRISPFDDTRMLNSGSVTYEIVPFDFTAGA